MKNNLTKAFNFHNSNFYFFTLLADHSYMIPENLLKTTMAIVRFMPNAYPRIETLAEMTGLSKRTVMRQIQKLESLGIIKVTREHRKSNRYDFVLGDIIVSLKNESLGCQNQVVRVTNSEARVTNSALLGDNMVSLQHINKHINIKHIKEHINDYVINGCVENADEGGVDPDMLNPDTRAKWMAKQFNKTD